MGIRYHGVPINEFLDAIKARGPTSPVYKFVPLMTYWRRYWFDPNERDQPFPIRNQNIIDDVPGIEWPPLRKIFLNSFLYCIRAQYFPTYSKSLYVHFDDAINAAEEISGLFDAGPELEFSMQPMELIRESMLNESTPTFTGYLSTFRTTRQYLINMMAMEDNRKLHPEIEDQTIDPPIVICGLNRSGTTFLQNLLAQDSTTRSVRACEMLAPYGHDGRYRPHNLPNSATEEEWADDPRIEYAQEVLDTQLGTSDEWNSIHSQAAAAPEEEFMILEQVGRCYSICSAFDVPGYRKWLFADDCQQMKEGYRFHKRFLQHLQWQRRGSRWLLKMPFHLFTLDALFSTYPDARIIVSHRDPKEVIASWCSLVKYARQNLTNADNPIRIGQEELEAMSMMMSNGLKFRGEHPELADRFIDVQYTDVIENPMGVVESLYESMGLELTDKTRRDMKAYIDKNKQERKKMTKHTYSLEEYGLTVDDIEKSFSSYYNSGHLSG